MSLSNYLKNKESSFFNTLTTDFNDSGDFRLQMKLALLKQLWIPFSGFSLQNQIYLRSLRHDMSLIESFSKAGFKEITDNLNDGNYLHALIFCIVTPTVILCNLINLAFSVSLIALSLITRTLATFCFMALYFCSETTPKDNEQELELEENGFPVKSRIDLDVLRL